MSQERNKESQESLKQEIKALQAKCVNTCHIIDNAPPDFPNSEEETSKKINNYVEGLRIELQNSHTTFSTDSNLLTSQFLMDMKKKNEQLNEIVAFTKGNIHDMNAEINRLQSLIEISKEARSKPKTSKAKVKDEHIQKAKERFTMMKKTIYSLVESLFPSCHAHIMDLVGDLMFVKMSDNPNGYHTITADNYKLIEILKDLNVVVANPYNEQEIKLTYHKE